jgi:hypothetical protein
LSLTSLINGGSSVGLVRLRNKSHGVLFVFFVSLFSFHIPSMSTAAN